MHENLCFFELFYYFLFEFIAKTLDIYLPFSVKLENILMESVFSEFEKL